MVELTVGPLEDLQIETEDLEVVLGTLTAKVIEYATTSNVIVQEMAVALEVMEVALGVTTMEEVTVEALGEVEAHLVVRRG